MPRFCLVTNIVSPHQLPLARRLVAALGADNFRYVATEPAHDERAKLGWTEAEIPAWVLQPATRPAQQAEATEWMQQADIVLCGNRDLDLFESRCCREKITLYMSERWFKPPLGLLRLLHPRFARMVLQFRHLARSPYLHYLPIGTYAALDMRWIADFADREKLLSCSVAQLLSSNSTTLPASNPTTQQLNNSATFPTVHSRMHLWGYFIEPPAPPYVCSSQLQRASHCRHTDHPPTDQSPPLHILWVGRMLKLKRLDTLIKAVAALINKGYNIQLTLVGHGPEEARLRRMADEINMVHGSTVQRFSGSLPLQPSLTALPSAPCPSHSSAPLDSSASSNSLDSSPTVTPPHRHTATPVITFHPPVPIAEVRTLMHNADVYVLPSNGYEGWGAVVNEAMSEGCAVVASSASGAAKTMIRDGENGLLFKSGDWRQLAAYLAKLYDDEPLRQRLAQAGQKTVIESWSPQIAAERLIAFCDTLLTGKPPPAFSEGPLSAQ